MRATSASLESGDSSTYAICVDRTEELQRLRAQVQRRKSMLVFGPEGVGKTRLLHRFVKSEPLAIYVRQTGSPRDLMIALIESLRVSGQKGIRLPASMQSCSTNSLKGAVDNALDQYPFLLVLDQVSGPSRVVTSMIKDLNYYDRTPIVFAARTQHMEDIGTLQPLCSDRSERTEVKNFAPAIALEFVRKQAEDEGLRGSNLQIALESMVDWTQGNPGSLIQMVRMAKLPKYRMDDQIKVHVLYLDHLMGRRERLPQMQVPT